MTVIPNKHTPGAIRCAATAEKYGIPVVECHRHAMREGDACDTWITAPCPFCGQCHSHGAGEGLRSPHCTSRRAPSDYYLIESGRGR
jgi:hypothetical protein